MSLLTSTSRFETAARGAPAPAARRWDAQLCLTFRRDPARTTLSHRSHRGPLGVQRPFYPEADGTCHTYLLHPPGGIAPGDHLEIRARLLARARALITTPAATKLYRTSHASLSSSQTQHLVVDDGALLEWLPQETIVFDGAHSGLTTRVSLAGQAGFIGWEILSLGRPACGERFARGRLRQRFEIERDGRPLLVERSLYEGGSRLMDAAFGLGGHPIVGTFACVTDDTEGPIAELRAALPETRPDGQPVFGVSQLRGVLVCRYLGDRTEQALHGFRRAWEITRAALHNRTACAPRIWST